MNMLALIYSFSSVYRSIFYRRKGWLIDIDMHHRTEGLKRVFLNTNDAYDVLQCPRLYGKGEVDYDWDIVVLTTTNVYAISLILYV